MKTSDTKQNENDVQDVAVADATPATEATQEEKKEVTSDVADNKETKEEKKEEENKDSLVLKNLDVDFAFDVLSVPTCSHHEYRMVTFILLWARANKVAYEFDDYGNIYLTKGTLEEGEFYPCVTSHLDTVQREQEAYAQCGVKLNIKERKTTKGHELFVDDTGIGADDKAGVLISLSLFEHFDKLKACFFLEEEVGCKGSEKLNKAWFDNVGYVIGWDSPDRNRAAFACSGELLMSKDFFLKIKETCKENGVTDFRAEPYTDVKEIRKQTGVVCCNFGNGGYNAHMPTEYVVLEHIDGALGMGIELIKTLGTEKYRMPSKQHSYSYTSAKGDEDIEFFAKLDRPVGGTYTTYRAGATSTNASTTNSSSKSTTGTTKKEDQKKIEPHVLEYVVERYEKHIDNIEKKCEEREATILHSIKKLIEDGKGEVKYEDIVKIFNENLSSEPFTTAIEF